MRRTKYMFYFLLCLIFTFACEQKPLEQAYIEEIEAVDGTARKLRKIAGYAFDVQYQPLEYRVLKALGPQPDMMQFNQDVAERKGMEYFLLHLSKEDGSNLAELLGVNQKQDGIYYLSFGMQSDIYLETRAGKKHCDIYHFERSYDLKGGRNFTLGFEVDLDEIEEMTLVINSDVLGTGPVKFHFDSSTITRFEN